MVGVKYKERLSRQLDLWRDMAESCCWWWCYENYVVCSERPTRVRMDERERIHSADGPAVAFADGWEVWAWHGMRVKPEIVRRSFKATDIDAEQNAELRRAMVEIYGAEAYLTETDTKPVQQDDYGTLYRREMRGDEPLCMVRVVNSTPEPDGSGPKIYWLRVPNDIRTAREAVAWTFGMRESEYAPVKET